jgi:enterochelin esterase-like enzyme
MSGILSAIEDAAMRGPRALARLIAETTFPRVEGRTVTFLYQGEAQEVTLQHWIHGLPPSLPLRRVHGSDVFVLQVDLPPGSRMEYKFGVMMFGRGAMVRDPLNPQSARDPFGANSVVYGEGYRPPEWSTEDPDARAGAIEDRTIQSEAFGEDRRVQVYLPARFRRTRRYPLLVVHDGQDYVSFASLRHVLDNLIHRLELPPMVVALTQSPDRMREYAGDDRHARFLTEDLVPQLEAEYPLVAHANARGLCGASFGAVASLHCAWRRPGFFGRLLLQSGSFVFTEIGDHGRGSVFDPVVEFVNAFRQAPGKPSEQVFMSCGVYESLIYFNRSLVPCLQETGMNVRLSEAHDGHNWENWRDRLKEGLSWLFPGPLWMVYE